MTKKRQSAKVPVAQFVAIIALSISVFLIIDLGRRAAANYRVQREAERLGQEVAIAHSYQQTLLARRSYVASDLYIEEVARRELKWARPGETVVVVMPTPEAVAQSPKQHVQVVSIGPSAQTPVEAWWLLFFGHDSFPRYTRATP
ncbi:MAG: septum formation initiator family protein [Anaerolineae bacterium]|nr:septum formation initiator family protein [Anaerolineae bacterium]